MRKAVEVSSHFERVTAWGPFDPGMSVRVAGQSRSHFSFLAHVTNTETGEEWIEVVGGKAGRSMRRAFPVEAVKPLRLPSRRSAGQPSSARLF